jgi:hypothetical protein
MPGYPLILADADRAEQFLLLGRPRSLFDGFFQYTDGDGNMWATKAVVGHTFAVTWLGSGWVFDPCGRRRRAEELNTRQRAMLSATPERHQQQLEAVIAQLRFGAMAERLLWVIHQQVLRLRSSLLCLPDFILADAIWGAERKLPGHWRTDIINVFNGLTWLHVIKGPITESTVLGIDTAILTHVADLRGNAADVCGEGCRGQSVKRHHHYLINVGRGFLGILEGFGQAEDDRGVRTYLFPVKGRHKQSSSLRQAGKSGQLVSIYLPAKLGSRSACENLTLDQHRLLQAIVRETTRNTRAEGQSVLEAEVMQGNEIPSINGKTTLVCPLLSPDGTYVGFNGNKFLKRRGYLVTSPGGWLAKAGYSLDQPSAFFQDMAVLAHHLALIPVGIEGGNHFLDLTQICTLTDSARGVNSLAHLHLRIYAPSDYLARWNQTFGWQDVIHEPQAANDPGLAVNLAIKEKNVSQKQLAEGMGVDRSLLNKVLRGKRPWPEGWLDRATSWLNSQGAR